MKRTLTDYYTKKQKTILYKDSVLPAFGEDGIEYMVFRELTDWGTGKPRTDCDIIDIKQKMAIKVWRDKEKEPIKFDLNKKAFDKATTIEEYINMINHK